MRFGLTALLLTGLALAAGEPGWVSLFDGETLDGWRVAGKPEDVEKGFWKVRDGAITADSRGQTEHDYVWLVNEGEYADFELKLKVRAYRDSTGNAGVQVRSRYDDEAKWMDGPQMDVHPPAPFRVGLIYDETRETRRWIYPSMPNWEVAEGDAPHEYRWKYADDGDGWNNVQIVCEGTRIRTVLNGGVVTDEDFAGILDDAAHATHRVGLKGHVALQLHRGAELNLQYKDIFVRILR